MLEPIGHVPATEFEQLHCQSHMAQTVAGGLN